MVVCWASYMQSDHSEVKFITGVMALFLLRIQLVDGEKFGPRLLILFQGMKIMMSWINNNDLKG